MPVCECVDQDATVRGVIIDDQNEGVLQPAWFCWDDLRALIALSAKIPRKMEGTPLPWMALDLEPPSYQRDQLGGDRQTKAYTAILASRGAIGLREWLKDGALLFYGDPHPGITH